MTSSQFLTRPVYDKLLDIYERFIDRSRPVEHVAQFDEVLKEFLLESGREFKLKPAEILFEEGDPGDNIYWIESGVLVVLQGDLEDPRLLAFQHPGQVVGEIALLANSQRSATIAALTAARLQGLSTEKFQALLSLIPGFGVQIMRSLSSRLREIKPAEYSDSFYDHLTGALSRKAFEFRLKDEIERARLYEYAFSLVFLDLDLFKEINDTYGHARGDEVLVEFCRRITADLRATDLFFRYGGDEFILMLQGIDDARGKALVERLLNRISTTPFPGDPQVTMTFSAGIAYFPADGSTPEALLSAADERAYKAKSGGRGQVNGGG